MVRLGGVMALLAALWACKPPPEAPQELEELSRYLYREWGAEDLRVQADGLRELAALLDEVPLVDGALLDRSWSLPDLEPDDVAPIDRPDRDLSAAPGVAVATRSVWPVADHARQQTEADQTPFEPTAKDHYDRSFVDPADPACFVDGGCAVMVTSNEATRKNLVIPNGVTFLLHKTFRWVDMNEGVEDEPPRMAFLSRSWFSESWSSENGKTTLFQSYSVDVWIPDGDGTVRYQTLWSETDLGIPATEDQVIGTVKGGIDSFYRHVDRALADAYHAGELPAE